MSSSSQDTFELDSFDESSAPSLRPRPGRRFGDFELVEVIGKGSYAEVWRARQRGLAREVAVKVLHGRLLNVAGVGARFAREADLASRLEHPHAAHVYAVGVEPDGTRWIAMELVRGVTLARWVELHGRMELPAFLAMMERLGDVVGAAHDLGLVHRDIKPANIVVRSVGGRLLPKLMDFGLARLAQDSLDPASITDLPAPGDVNVTGAGAILGSPAYMAPEQWRDAASVGPAADQYALAVVGWVLLTGGLPFQAASIAAVGQLHQEGPIPHLPPELPAEVDAVMRRALAKAPEARWPDVHHFVRALRDATRRDGPELPALDPQRRERALRDLPTPLAESVARVADATTLPAAAAGLRLCGRLVLRWLGALSLATRPALRFLGAPPAADAVLGRLARGRVPDEEWASLVEEQLSPWRALREECPLPALLAVSEAEGPEALLPTLVALARTPEDDVPAGMTRLERVLARLDFLADYRVVSHGGGGRRTWAGLRRREAGLGEGAVKAWVGLEDQDGVLVLRLSPLVEAAAPGPGAPTELFVYEGPNRTGSNAVAWPAGYERAIDSFGADGALEGSGPAASLFATEDDTCPWPGLDPWESGAAQLFVGRERELAAVANRLRATGFVAVVGASGAGKSSFLRAGLLPALPEGWKAALLRPGRAPLAALAAALAARVAPGLEQRLRADPAALGRELAGDGGGERVHLLAVDQLEELVTLSDPDDARVFAAALELATGPTVRVVATLRDDFLARVGGLGLAPLLSGATFILETPDRITLGRILTEPLRLRGYALEEVDLPERVAEELQGRPAALALLSFAGTRLWARRDPVRRLVPAGVYNELGGVAGMVARHAEATWEAMPEAERDATRAIFGRLFTSAGTRARVPRPELLEATGDPAAAEGALRRLLAARLLVEDEDAGVEVAHESLLGVWPRLSAWHRERGALARFREQLGEAARQWEERGRPPGLLWRGESLVELHLWRARAAERLTAREQAFADTCEAEARRERRNTRRLQVGVIAGLLAVIAALATLYQRAHDAERAASENAAEARGQLRQVWSDRARQSLADDPWRALVYLSAAMSAGWDTPSARALVGVARRMLPPSRVIDGGGYVAVGPALGRKTRIFRREDGSEVEVGPDATLLETRPAGSHGRSCGGALEVWETKEWSQFRRADGTPLGPAFREIGCVGSLAYVVGQDGTVALLDTVAGTEVARAHHGAKRLWSSWGDAAAPFALVGFEDAPTAVLDLKNGLRRPLDTERDQSANAVTDAGGRRAALWGGGRGGFDLVDLATGRLLATTPPGCSAGRAAVTPDARHVVLADEVCGMRRVSADTGETELVYQPPEGHVPMVDLVGDKVFFQDGTVWRLFDLQSGRRLADWRVPRDTNAVADGEAIYWTTRDGLGHITRTDVLNVAVADMPQERCDQWAGSPDGDRWVCLGERDGADRATVWDRPSQRWIGVLDTPPAGLGRAVPAFTPDGRSLVLGGLGPAGRVWTPEGGELLLPAPGNPAVRIARASPDGRWVASGGQKDELRFHDGATGELLRTVPLGAMPFGLAWSPDASEVAVSLGDGTVSVRRRADGSERLLLSRHERYAKTVAWSEDGRQLLSGAGDGSVRLWSAADGTLTSSFLPGYAVLDAKFGPGPFVTVTGFSGPVQVWDPEEGALVVELGRTAMGPWVSPDRSTLRYVLDQRFQQFVVEPWTGTAAELAAEVECLVPMERVESRVVDRRRPCAARAAPGP